MLIAVRRDENASITFSSTPAMTRAWLLGPVRPAEPVPAGQPGFQRVPGQRRAGPPGAVQRPGVDRPPLAVADRLDPVQPQDVHVQLRVPVAAGVLREDRHRDLVRVLEPAGIDPVGPLAVVTGPDVAAFPLDMGDVPAHRLLDLGPDAGRAGLPLPGGRQVPVQLGLHRVRGGGRMRQGDGLIHENVESKYWAPTFGVSARASIHNSVRRCAVAPGSAASFAW